MVYVDRAQFEVIETGEGFLKARVTFAVPGVLPYLYADGLKLEAKLPEEILSQQTIESAKGVPVTDGHPTDSEGNHIFVDSSNYQLYAKGNLSEPRIEGGVGVALATVYDPVLIQAIKDKERNSVSIGFKCDTDFTPGLFNGVHYDSVQRNILINHLACVDFARAGEATKIHVDRGIVMSKENIAAGAGDTSTSDDNKTYSYRKFDGSRDMAVSQEIHSELMMLRNTIKADQDEIEMLKQNIASISPSIPDPQGETEKADLMAKLDQIQAEVSAWKEKYSQLEAAVPEMADEMATEQVQVRETASGIDGISVDGLSVKEIKMQIIAKGLPFKEGVKVDGLSDDVINSRYDAAVELLSAKANLPEKNKSTAVNRVDSISIQEKRAALKNMYKGRN